MKFGKLRNVCNSRFYSLEVYGSPRGRISLDLDTESTVDRCELAKYSEATVSRVQPFVTDDGEPALEVELNL